MIKRHLQALAAGIAVGIVLQESAWTGLDWVDPTRSLNEALVSGPDAPGLLVPLLFTWLLGGFAGGLMGSLVGRHRAHGIAVGILLAASACSIAVLAWPDAGALLVVGAVPLPAAIVAAGLAGRVLQPRSEADEAIGVDTLRAGD
ncbi:MAG: hypothetical protein ACNS61_06065 [Candidatus Wenzhouxiangella sp. M2_3B_020]